MRPYTDVVANLPNHLKQYVVEQNYDRYTPVDQATWRFILRQLKHHLSKHAHSCYLEGLEKTGITIQEIPKVEDICEKLQDFGWSAVPVSGFIPPAAFMEMQSLGILPIASDMRSIEHILYTPAPDIVHEAAGHAPILIHPEFAQYLKEYAHIAKKAIISSEDLAQYEAIRDLSDIKENPDSTAEQIQQAENKLNEVNSAITHTSEASRLGRMNWWTAEYGLIGDLKNPKIFGAGILSSVGEARSCLDEAVKKIPLTVDCVESTYDITEKQPQLFVTPSFEQLTTVLNELADRLAFTRGGSYGLDVAKKSKTTNTIELDTGLQIAGTVESFITDDNDNVVFLKTTGATQIALANKQLDNHGPDYHSHGYSTPLGKLVGLTKHLSDFANSQELASAGIETNKEAYLKFESGFEVTGTVSNLLFIDNQLKLISFTNCTVKKCTTNQGDTVFFEPEWGVFDMAVAETVKSVYAGPADRESYGHTEHFVKKVIPLKTHSSDEKIKHAFYQQVRTFRQEPPAVKKDAFEALYTTARENYSNQWLLFVELVEITYLFPEDLKEYRDTISQYLMDQPENQELIRLGLHVAGQTLL